MSNYIGDFRASSTIVWFWPTSGATGASITRATNGNIRIYKGTSTTERSSSAGITDTEDFDSLTGVHALTIDTSNNADAGFYAAGNDYNVVLQGAVIDSLTVNVPLFSFSIENRTTPLIAANAIADVVHGRSVSNSEGTAAEHSITTLVLAILESVVSGTTWTIKRTDGSTTHATKTVASDPLASPITSVT